MADEVAGARPPWHFWLVVVIAVLWNGFGGYDYTMSQLQGDAYFRQMGMTEAQIAYMHAYPTWMIAVWAVGVWGSVLGSILLILRSRYAFAAFGVALAAFLISLVYSFLLTDGAETMGQMGAIMTVVILAGCVFFTWYSRLMAKRGVLR